MDLVDDLTAILPLPGMLQGKIKDPETRKSLSDLFELIKDVMEILLQYSAHATASKQRRYCIEAGDF